MESRHGTGPSNSHSEFISWRERLMAGRSPNVMNLVAIALLLDLEEEEVREKILDPL